MDLKDAARYFDHDPVYDGYSGALLFYGHTKPHNDHTSSGATSRRRTLVTIPTNAAPARGVVTLYSEQWLMGSNNPDTYQGNQIRRSFDMKKSTGLMKLLTPGQACLSGSGTDFHAHKEYFKDMVDPLTSSEYDVMWNIFCPPSEAVIKGSFFREGSIIFRVRNVYDTVELLNVAETDQLDADALQSATFTGNAGFNLITDVPTSSSVATTVIQTDVPKFYQFRTEQEAERKPGDRTVFVAKSAVTPKVSATFTMLGTSWRVLAVVSESDAWAMLVRRA